MSEHRNLAVVRSYMDRVVAGDLEGALQLAWDDAVFQGPDGSVMNKDSLRALFASLASLLVNPFEQKIIGTTCEGDRVAVEATGRTVLANGKTYSNLYHFLFEVREGKIAASREYCNTRAADAFAP